MVRYLPVDGKALPAPVKEIILIKYDPDVDFKMEKLPRTEKEFPISKKSGLTGIDIFMMFN